jgi:Tol biopolymer transport system component
MSAFDRSERFQVELPDILTAIAAPQVPDYTDDLLALTSATRQRPRWTFLERWLPMGAIARRRVFLPTIPWRPIVVAAALIALVAAGLLFVGSQRHVPPPFGPARNGALVFDSGGDIAGRDSLTGTSRTLVGGPGDDFAAGFTRDGTHLVFLRRTAGTSGSSQERIQPFIAEADGSNPRPLSGDLEAPDWFDWSPDDQQLVVQEGAHDFGEHLYLYDRDQGARRQLDAGRPMTSTIPNFLGPDGLEIVFRGLASTEAGVQSGIFAIHPDGSGFRAITPTDGDRNDGYQFPQPSPDGRYVTYSVWNSAIRELRIHLVDPKTGNDRTIDDSIGHSQGYATFSPDGRLIMFTAFSESHAQVMVEPVDGSSAAIPMGPIYAQGNDVAGLFSPDGRSVIVKDATAKVSRLIDAATGGDGQVLPWSADGITAWQRLAP